MPSDPSKASGPYLDLEEDNEDLGEEVQKTNTELEKLKRQLEDIEKQKLRLEELKKRQDELEVGRSEMADKLTRSLVTVQREAEEAQKRLEQLNSIHNSFTQHLRYIEAINPKAWGALDLPKELERGRRCAGGIYEGPGEDRRRGFPGSAGEFWIGDKLRSGIWISGGARVQILG